MIQALLPVKRWTKAAKAEVLWALSRRLVTLDQLCRVHALSPEEIHEWMRNRRLLGDAGLCTTRAQECRTLARSKAG